MADEADKSDAGIENVVSDAVGRASRYVSEIPYGKPGECDGCGEWAGRLVDGYCAPCRDRYARFIK